MINISYLIRLTPNFLKKSINYHFRPHNYPIVKVGGKDVIFIHINKTGGTSISKALGMPHKRHLPVKRIIDIVGERHFEKSIKFCVVRNPWSKAVSHYKYLLQRDQYDLATDGVSFKDWVKMTYGEEKHQKYYYNPIMFMEQVDWLKERKGVIRVNHILKFENLNEEFARLAKIIGSSAVLPKLNASGKVDFRDYYDDETRLIIERASQNDIEMFGYSFHL